MNTTELTFMRRWDTIAVGDRVVIQERYSSKYKIAEVTEITKATIKTLSADKKKRYTFSKRYGVLWGHGSNYHHTTRIVFVLQKPEELDYFLDLQRQTAEKNHLKSLASQVKDFPLVDLIKLGKEGLEKIIADIEAANITK